MAEAFLKEQLVQAYSEIKVLSAGTNAENNLNATEEAIKAMEKFEIDLSNHKTRLLDQHIVDGAELIIVMTRPHELSISKIQQKARNRTFLIGEIVRLGSLISNSGKLPPINSWVKELHSARGGHMTSGRAADEIPDPFGKSFEEYEKVAKKLHGICEVLSKLLTSGTNKNP